MGSLAPHKEEMATVGHVAADRHGPRSPPNYAVISHVREPGGGVMHGAGCAYLYLTDDDQRQGQPLRRTQSGAPISYKMFDAPTVRAQHSAAYQALEEYRAATETIKAATEGSKTTRKPLRRGRRAMLLVSPRPETCAQPFPTRCACASAQ